MSYRFVPLRYYDGKLLFIYYIKKRLGLLNRIITLFKHFYLGYERVMYNVVFSIYILILFYLDLG